MANKISNDKYNAIIRKAFYIKQNPKAFVDAVLEVAGVEVEAPTSSASNGDNAQDGDSEPDDNV